MVKRILLSTAILATLATNAWAQGSGCSSCDANAAVYSNDVVYSQVVEGGCASGNCGVGQGYFSPQATGCGIEKYARLYAGVGYVDDLGTDGTGINFSDGWGGGGALGRRRGRLRTELELSYRHNSFDFNFVGLPIANGNLSTTSGMANVMFDVIKIRKFNLYSGGGIGLIYGDLHQVTDGGAAVDDEAFAYQGILGVDRNIRNNMKGFVEYRYLTADFDFGGGSDIDYDANNIFFGFEVRR